MSDFTPGPWEILGDDEMAKNLPVIEISHGDFGPEFESVAYVHSEEINDKFVLTEKSRANARLIAAAPDLYAALSVLVNSDMAMREEDEGRVSEELTNAREVLARVQAHPTTSAAGE